MFCGICFILVYMYVLYDIGGVVCMGICIEYLFVVYCVYVQYLCVFIGQMGSRDWEGFFGYFFCFVLQESFRDF